MPLIEGKPQPNPIASPSSQFQPYPGYNPDPCYHDKNKDAADLCAQWRAALAAENAVREARRTTTWSIISAIMGSAGTVLIFAAWRAAAATNRISMAALKEARLSNQRAYKIARETSNAQLRPYLFFEDFDAEQQDWSRAGAIRMKLRNYGQTPAINIRMAVHSVVVKRPIKDVDVRPTMDFEEVPTLAPQAEHAFSMNMETIPEEKWRDFVNNGVIIQAYLFCYEGVGIEGSETEVFQFSCGFEPNGRNSVNILNDFERVRTR